MPLTMFVLNKSIVCIENADIVVKDPKKPITKKKYIGEDLLAKNPATQPIIKQPRIFTVNVPNGRRSEKLLFKNSVNKYLKTAPAPPPNAIIKRFMSVFLGKLCFQSQNYLQIQ